MRGPCLARQGHDRSRAPHCLLDTALAGTFVLVWGSGYLATKIGLQYAAPFTFLTLRYAFGVLCLVAIVAAVRPAFRDRAASSFTFPWLGC